jgi:hypothetical protein
MNREELQTVMENEILGQPLTPPQLVTETVIFLLQPWDPNRIHNWPTDCLWEPELFPVAQFKQWSPLCVNFFHTGKVVVLGRSTPSQLESISQSLQTFVRQHQ